MSGELDITEAELHAFVDGALESERCGAVEAAMAADAALAARIADFRADKELLQRVYAPLNSRPLPEEWLALAHRPPEPALSWRLVGAIAACLLVMLGAIGYWRMQPVRGDARPAEIVQAALEARGRDDGRAIAIAAGADAGRYDAVLSTAVALKVKVPDMRHMGYRLTGLHLYSGAAELSYRDSAARLFTLYVRRSAGGARFDQFARDGLRVCVWQDEEVSTVMAGNVSTAAMQRLASLAYAGLAI